MSFKLALQSEAVDDIQLAYEWYEEQKIGLGYSFLNEIDICFSKICTHPLQYGLINGWVRKIKVNRFPFLIVFEIEGGTVFINAVRHTSRHPKF